MTNMIETIGYPRAALVGNPSDGFNGRTIAFTFKNYSARVRLKPAATVSILGTDNDPVYFESVTAMCSEAQDKGYLDSIALYQATVNVFVDHCRSIERPLPETGFHIEARSDIPYQVGFAGSSAIIIALLRALMQHYSVSIDKPSLAALALSVETQELGIPGGLQDRVAQVYQDLVYMDFSSEHFERQGYGHYQTLDNNQLPSLYIAWRQSIAEGSEVFHNDIRQRHAKDDPLVLEAIHCWKTLTDEFLHALTKNDVETMHRIMNDNFDRRAEIYNISTGNLEMIHTARGCGASAKFTGSGGAAIGIFHGEEMYQELQQRFAEQSIHIFKPQLTRSRAC